MTALDRLNQQIEELLEQQQILKSENKRLKQQLDLSSNHQEIIAKLQEERENQAKEIELLTQRLEKLLTL